MRFQAVLRIVLPVTAAASPALAQYAVYPDKTPPLYPQVILRADASLSDDPELSAFREALSVASRALKRTEQGQVYDPDPVLSLFADEMEVFVGQGHRSYRPEFTRLGRHPAGTALAMLGRLHEGQGGAQDDTVAQRHGMLALRTFLEDPTIGASAWLEGRICTAAYGKIAWPDWVKVNRTLNMPLEDWLIAVDARPGPDEWTGQERPSEDDPWPRPYQFVPASPEQKRSAGSIGILSPYGHTVFFDWQWGGDQGFFAPYLNNHLCFEKGEEGWKVSAFAYRLE